jgi:sec-independent protein translocase protein TatB
LLPLVTLHPSPNAVFDIGFSELLVIGVVALIVIGPERLPRVARTLGHLFGRMQRYVNDVKADISREMELEELRRLQVDMKEAAQSFEDGVTKEIRDTETQLQSVADTAVAPVAQPEAPTLPAPAASPAPQQLDLALDPNDRPAAQKQA